MIIIFLSVKSKKKTVSSFLKELKDFLEKEDFNINEDIVLINKNKTNDKEHSTSYTLLDLEYDIDDVVERLKELTVEEYSETKIDKDDINPPLLFVFGKNINGKIVYVKLKIKGNPKKYVLCVSIMQGIKWIFPMHDFEPEKEGEKWNLAH